MERVFVPLIDLGFLLSFPSPCGEVLMESVDFNGLYLAVVLFPSPCGEVLMERV